MNQTLEGTVELLSIRKVAWDIVQAVLNETNRPNPESNNVTYNSLKIDFTAARHLSLITYVSVTWSIYDRLASVCGRLAGTSVVANDPNKNPKIVEDFLDNKKGIGGFSLFQHLNQAYAWPIKATYKIRNWLVHEGYEAGGRPLFSGNRIVDGFRLHDDAVKHIQSCCGYQDNNGKIDFSCLTPVEECWQTRDLLRILESYHAEMDTMFTGLVCWTVDAFIGQIKAFTERDRKY